MHILFIDVQSCLQGLVPIFSSGTFFTITFFSFWGLTHLPLEKLHILPSFTQSFLHVFFPKLAPSFDFFELDNVNLLAGCTIKGDLTRPFDNLYEELGEKEDKIIALENDIQLLKDSKKAFMKSTLMVAIRDEDETCEFIDGGHETLPIDRREWLEILLDMNENDWNDDGCSELYFDGNVIMFRQKICRECDCSCDLLLSPLADGSYYICKECKCCNPKCYRILNRGGNNPQPLWTEGKCCNDCNDLVIMERMKQR